MERCFVGAASQVYAHHNYARVVTTEQAAFVAAVAGVLERAKVQGFGCRWCQSLSRSCVSGIWWYN
jgi:hypothetical protein